MVITPYGNGWFAGATIVAHAKTREAILHLDPRRSQERFTTVDFGEVRLVPPGLTFDHEIRIHLESITIEVTGLGGGHSAGDVVA